MIGLELPPLRSVAAMQAGLALIAASRRSLIRLAKTRRKTRVFRRATAGRLVPQEKK
jgi:hypothetical protein